MSITTNHDDAELDAAEYLVDVVQRLSLARSIEDVTSVVRTAARHISGADGATFVLRDGDLCFYVDEEAIAPLWKGLRFPMESCISGWSMLHAETVVIEDIYVDDRIPHEAYRPTFVHSLAMVPIRTLDPIGAIGNYWADHRVPTEWQLRLLRALADSAAVAMENVQVYAELEARVQQRTSELEEANHTMSDAMVSLREFIAATAHDLRGQGTALQSAALLLKDARVSENERGKLLDVIHRQTNLLGDLTDDLFLLTFADTGQLTAVPEDVALAPVFSTAAAHCTTPVDIVDGGLRVWADEGHVQRIMTNLVQNAERHGAPPVTVTARDVGTDVEILVSDGGDGVSEELLPRLFHRFARGTVVKYGTGLGLSIVDELARLNGGSAFYLAPDHSRPCTFGVRLPRS